MSERRLVVVTFSDAGLVRSIRDHYGGEFLWNVVAIHSRGWETGCAGAASAELVFEDDTTELVYVEMGRDETG